MLRRLLESVRSIVQSDSCGCAAGAVFLVLGLLTTAGWHVWHWEASAAAPGRSILEILGLSMLAALVGKICNSGRKRRAG